MQELLSRHLLKDAAVKYFSGQAIYFNSFEITAGDLKGDAVVLLSLNNVKEIADVYVNGKKVGQHWHPGQVLALTKELVPGRNELVIEVMNSINNGLVGDAKKLGPYRDSRSNITRLPNARMNPFTGAPLLEAGFIGHVTLQWAELVK